jgi:hypothetical protein
VRTERTDDSVLDRISPDEIGLPPSARSWARIIRLPGGWETLELRDPNSGQGSDPAAKPRHQYLVQRDRLWSRRLPPAPLDDEHDESRWRDEPQGIVDPRTTSAWQLVAPGSGLPWEWSRLAPYATVPRSVRGQWDIHGDGRPMTLGYEMPAADPWDVWHDVTDAPCPHPGCDQTLVWYEAGYVSGYRVCMGRRADGGYDRTTLRHRWLWVDAILVQEVSR